MTIGQLITRMADPRLVIAVVAVVGLLIWQRDVVRDQLGEHVREQWRWLALAGAGAWLGWSYQPQLAGVMEAIPL